MGWVTGVKYLVPWVKGVVTEKLALAWENAAQVVPGFGGVVAEKEKSSYLPTS